jgi:hypothetical protein
MSVLVISRPTKIVIASPLSSTAAAVCNGVDPLGPALSSRRPFAEEELQYSQFLGLNGNKYWRFPVFVECIYGSTLVEQILDNSDNIESAYYDVV